MNELEQAIAEIEIYGFTLLEKVLSTEVAEEMRQALIRCEREVGTEHTHRGSARHVSNLPTLDRVFHPCIDHPRVLPILEHFLEPSLILGSLNSRIVRLEVYAMATKNCTVTYRATCSIWPRLS